MKSRILIFLVICLVFHGIDLSGQDSNESNTNHWSIVASYNPMVAGTYSGEVNNTDGNVYLFGGDVGVQYNKSSSLIYTFDFGYKYNRMKSFHSSMPSGEISEIYTHSKYTFLSLGIEYLPFNFSDKLNPFIGASIAPYYFHNTLSSSGEFVYGRLLPNQLLLLANIELGLYFSLTNKLDLRISASEGYNLLPAWKYFGMVYGKIGVRYKF
jgi:hypothetical protein